MNLLGAAAVIASICVFAISDQRLRGQPMKVRWTAFGALTGLALPAIGFTIYYLHVVPEQEWFYALRSWPGTEFLVVFLGGAAGAFSSLLPRRWLVLPLAGLVVCAIIPYLKPLLGPVPDEAFSENWRGEVCLQSTPSTCGPASVTTILKRLGSTTTERDTARAAFTYLGGTEAWYLARYVRRKGLATRFVFRRGFHAEAGLPAMVGVRLGGGAGHFIAVLDLTDDQVTYADPLYGERRLPLADFIRYYDFTGFHMVIRKT